MANKLVKLLINSAEFPLPYTTATRSVVQSDDAGPRMPQAFYGDNTNADFGSPQLLFGENFVPTSKGVQSVGYAQQAAPFSGAVTTFDQAITLRDADENMFLVSPAGGANYVYNPFFQDWASVDPFVFPPGGLITRAYVNGRSFICYEKERVVELNAAGTAFTTISFTFPLGLTMADVRGIAGASNYLLIFTELTIYWCSPLNILDFDALDGGAGNQIPIDIAGLITAVLPLAGGFIIYTARNAIAATYTNDSNSPFVFKEVNNVGGVISWEQVTPDADELGHYAWTQAGLQFVQLTGATPIFPAVTDYFAGGRFSDYDYFEHRVSTIKDVQFTVKLAFLSKRYLVLSYGVNSIELSHALVYDSTLRRWGHLMVDHVDAFSYPYSVYAVPVPDYNELLGSYVDQVADYDFGSTNALRVPRPKQGVAFLQKDGTVYVLDLTSIQSNGVGVVVFGHIQQRHSNYVTLLGVEVEGFQYTVPVGGADYESLSASYAFYSEVSYAELALDLAETLTVQPSDTGAERQSTVPVAVVEVTDEYIRGDTRITAKNFDITIEGNFAISSLLVEVMQHGTR
jgi:hypothetical protein